MYTVQMHSTDNAILCVKNSTHMKWLLKGKLHHCMVYCTFQGGASMLTCLCYFTPSREPLQSMSTKIWTLSQLFAFWLNEFFLIRTMHAKNAHLIVIFFNGVVPFIFPHSFLGIWFKVGLLRISITSSEYKLFCDTFQSIFLGRGC